MSSQTGDAASSLPVVESDPGTAVNIFGVAYEHSIVGREQYTFLYAQKPNSTPLKREQWPVVKSGLPNAQELLEEDNTKYLWVGMSPRGAENEVISKKKKDKKKGVTTMTYDEGALRVVVLVTETMAAQCKFYALVGGNGGLCETRCIETDLVFYFTEFRTKATTVLKRRQEWNANIRQAAVFSTPSKRAESSIAVTFAKGSDADPRLNVPFEVSLANEIQLYLASYSITKEPWLLDHLSSILERASPDLRARPTGNVHLCLFLESKDPLSREEAEGVVTEATTLQPGIEITTESVELLHRGRVEQKDLYLPYSHLLPFLALGHKRITEFEGHSLNSATIHKLTKTVVEDLALVLPSPNSTTSNSTMSPDMWQALFSSLLSSLKELLTYNERYMEEIAKENGPQAVGDSLDVIWKTFARRSDVDSCKMWATQVARYMHAAVNNKSKDIGQKVQILVNVLETLKLNT